MAAVGTTIYIFGGENANYKQSDKLWAFDLDTRTPGHLLNGDMN
jgi:hypothetical protein